MQSTSNPQPKKPPPDPQHQKTQIEREINHVNWTPSYYAYAVLKVADRNNTGVLADLEIRSDDGVPVLYFEEKQIVSTKEIDRVLRNHYYSLENGLCGADILFKRVNEKFLGITQLYTREWLKRQELAQRFK